MTWIVVDCDLFEHPKMAALPNDTARYGWLAILGKSKRQRKPGVFASEAHFKEVAGRFARFLPQYLAVRLMDRTDDGLAVHDWQRHQWAGKKAGQREDNEGTSEGQTEDSNETLAGASRAVAVNVPIDVVSSSGVRSGEGDLLRLVEKLTNRPFDFSPGSRVWNALTQDEKALGAERVESALREEHAAANGRPLDAASLIFGAHKRLYPISQPTPKAKGLNPSIEEAVNAFRS